MKKIICFLSFLVLYSLFYLNVNVEANTGTDVEGVLKTDTIWTKEGSPYNLIGDLQVGGKLTIEPGVTVNGNRKILSVFGELNIVGSEKEKVKVFKVSFYGGNATKKGAVSISNSQLFNCGYFFGWTETPVQIKNSWIDDSIGQGIYYGQYTYIGPYSILEGNSFSNTLPIVIQNNTILRNNTFLGDYQLLIHGNRMIYLNYNNFLGTEDNVVRLNAYDSKLNDAENNFWNTKTRSDVAKRIYDGNDDLMLDNTINFNSYLEVPDRGSSALFTLSDPVITTEISPRTQVINGHAEPDSVISYEYISTSSYEAGGGAGKVFADSAGDFEIILDNSGRFTYYFQAVKNGIKSGEVKIVATDDIPPLKPIVSNVISDRSKSIKGIAEAGSTIEIKKDLKLIGKGKANLNYSSLKDGYYYFEFDVPIELQTAGTILSVTATDSQGNTSESFKIIVTDETSPLPPVVNKVTDQSVSLSGTAEPFSFISVNIEINNQGYGIADSTGKFEVNIRRQKAGTKLLVTSSDLSGNGSEETKVIVEDATAPAAPEVNEVTDRMTTVSGITEANVGVTVKAGEKVIGTTESNVVGVYEVTIPRQEGGTKLSVIATDAAKNNSEATETIVKDVTAPSAPKVNEVTDRMTTVSGATEAKAVVTVKVGDKVIGTTEANAAGVYEVTIPRQEGGTKLSVIATDAAKNNSEATETIVKDVTAPSAPKVNEVTDRMTTVSGATEAKAVVTVKVGDKVIGTTEANAAGVYEVTIPRQEGGTKLSVIATDAAKNNSEATETIVKDVTAPLAPKVNEVTDRMTTVSGTTEAKAVVTVKVGDKVIGTTEVNAAGVYEVTIPRQEGGTKLSVIATDAAKNNSEATETIVKDVTAPLAPKVNEVTDRMTTVSGTTEAKAVVTVKVGDKVIGTTEANAAGVYEVTIPRQEGGTKLSVIATDATKNNSEATETIVKDVTAPLAPKVNEVTDRMTTVSGMTEAKALITVKVGEKVIGTTEANATGVYEVTIPRQEGGTKLSVIATDATKNNSEATETIVKDVTAPLAPKVNEVTDRMTTVSGMTEAKALITFKVGEKVIGTTEANATGVYEVTIPRQEGGTKLSVIATDAAKNNSEATETIVKDVTAPILSGVTDSTVQAGEPFDPKRNVAAMDKVDGNVTNSIAIAGAVNTNKVGLYSLIYSVKDRAGNQTKMTRRVMVKDTIKPVLSGVTSQSINLNSTFDPKKGITAKDNIDGDMTKSIQVSGTVNLKKVGIYTLTYKVADRSGNTTTLIRKITVKDNIKPVITGAKSKTIKYKSSFNPMTGVAAKDNVDGSLTKSIKVTGSVNTKRKGVYTLTYNVKDKAGNSTSTKIKITVR